MLDLTANFTKIGEGKLICASTTIFSCGVSLYPRCSIETDPQGSTLDWERLDPSKSPGAGIYIGLARTIAPEQEMVSRGQHKQLDSRCHGKRSHILPPRGNQCFGFS
jgi:hypothetical protein